MMILESESFKGFVFIANAIPYATEDEGVLVRVKVDAVHPDGSLHNIGNTMACPFSMEAPETNQPFYSKIAQAHITAYVQDNKHMSSE